MVCLGNICRSPLAEGILKSKVNTSEIFIDSAGMGDYHVGELPDKRSIQVAGENTIDITTQRARQFKIADFEHFDIIYAMDVPNYRRLMALAQNSTHQSKIRIILNELHPGQNLDVPDPYYDTVQEFRSVYTMLDQACEVIASNLNQKN